MSEQAIPSSTPSPPTISVVMSAFNSEKFIVRAIQSILDQTFTDFEFIILNDGSTDATADIIRGFDDKRIRFYDYKKNLGLSTRLNQGFDLVTGAYIARMDADDWSFPQRFQTQLDYLEQHPDIDILGAAVLRIHEGPPDYKEYLACQPLIDTLPIDYAIIHPTAMLRCSTLPATVRYNPAALGMEDYQFWLDLLPHMKMANLPEVLLAYYRHPNDSGRIYGVGQASRAVGCALDFIQTHLGEDLPQRHEEVVRSLKDATATIQLEKLSALYRYYKNKTLSVAPVDADPIRLTPRLLNALFEWATIRRMETLNYNWGLLVERTLFRRYFHYHFKPWRKRVREPIREFLGLRHTVRPMKYYHAAKPVMSKLASPLGPTISVVMSAFNSEKFIVRAIQSILDQTFTDFEFIILNDGSTDATADIIRGFDDKRIRFYDYKENLGLPTRLNQGFDLVTGAYIARMDADDWSFPQRFQTQMDYLEQHPDIDILGTAAWRIQEDTPDEKEYLACAPIIDTLPIDFALLHSTVILRYSTLPAMVRYNPAALGMEDYQFWLDLLPHMKMANLPEVLFEYHRHSNDSGRIHGVGQASRALGCALDFIQTHLGEDLPQRHEETVRSLKDATATIQLEKLSALYRYYKNRTLSVAPVDAALIRLTPRLLNALFEWATIRRMETLNYNWGLFVQRTLLRRYFHYHFKLWQKRVWEPAYKSLGLHRIVRSAK